MNELRETSFMSNRGRQNAASFLINDLKQPWYLGAMYFEHHLIDYDVYSNYGNWTYLAGVGADPRKDRVFNLNRQAQMYDPDGEYVHQWAYT
jgi:deoxyribodipyrimidine photo-lyase